MPPWLSVAVPFLAVLLNALVNLRLRFAPDRATAERELRDLALSVGSWGMNVTALVFLVSEVLSPGPVTRMSVLVIAGNVGALLLFLITRVAQRINEVERHVLGQLVMFMDQFQELLDTFTRLVGQVEFLGDTTHEVIKMQSARLEKETVALRTLLKTLDGRGYKRALPTKEHKGED